MFFCYFFNGKQFLWLLIASLDHRPLRNKGYPERKEFVSRGANSFLSVLAHTQKGVINPIALRKAKIVYNFGLSECSRVNESGRIATVHSVPYNLTNYSGIIWYLKFDTVITT